MRCDCGYDFESKSVKDSYLSAKEQEQIRESQNGDLYTAAKIGINKGVLGGIMMMAVAAIWFIAGYQAGVFFYYPPIIFAIGIYAFLKGIYTGNISGNK